MQIKKREALSVLEKLCFDARTRKERFAKFFYDGKLVLTTAVPKGSGDNYSSNQFRQQLKLDEEQLGQAIRCPFRYKDYVAHLRDHGHIL